jgi:uncharacterized repeat protein (TIGR03803 family)
VRIMSRHKSLGIPGAILVASIVILVLTPGAWAGTYKTLYKFTGGADGSIPFSDLIFDAAGNLYGTTVGGGDHGDGTVFRLTPNADGTWTESVLYSFCSLTNCSDGEDPGAGVIFDSAGSLFGTASSGGAGGGGAVFKLTPNADGSWTESVLYSFCSLTSCGDGQIPTAGLIFGSAGNLYGTTTSGGDHGGGTVFKLTPNVDGSWSESVLHGFDCLTNCSGGYDLEVALIFDSAGNLYGTTASGGDLSVCHSNGCGVVFRLKPQPDGSWTESVIHTFKGGRDGASFASALIFDGAGNLYSTTAFGGNMSQCINGRDGCGVVFQLTPQAHGSWKEKVLHRFKSSDGVGPYGSLIVDRAGNLYGTTVRGGKVGSCGGPGCGVVFKLAPNSKGGWSETVLHRFLDHRGTGAYPSASLIFDATGNLYGTTEGDFKKTHGSVFEIVP